MTMRTPVPGKACPEPGRRAEEFKLTDDCTLSGVRLRPDDRRVDGGGYFYPERNRRVRPDCPDRLVTAHGVVEVPVAEVVGRRLKPGERVVANPYYPEG